MEPELLRKNRNWSLPESGKSELGTDGIREIGNRNRNQILNVNRNWSEPTTTICGKILKTLEKLVI